MKILKLSYYAGIMLNAVTGLYAQNFAAIIGAFPEIPSADFTPLPCAVKWLPVCRAYGLE